MTLPDRQPELYIGLMSGTSMDGVDGVLIDLAPGAGHRILTHHHAPFDPALRQSLFELNQPGDNELHRAALAANGVANAYAQVVAVLLQQSGIAAQQVRAIGAHGQTVRHRPGEFDGIGYTCQLLNAALLAECTGVDVVADFRSRDVAAGGQGAPLVPAFHHAAFAMPDRDMAILNVGGIANITLLAIDGTISGHDCGPGNVLMDLWCAEHTGQAFDADGAWARSGKSCLPLLQAMLQDSYLQRPPPKSTGRDHFNTTWLRRVLADFTAVAGPLPPQDVQHTLTQFTAAAAAADLQRLLPSARQLLVCGGGAFNSVLLDCLRQALPAVQVQTIDKVCGMHPMHVEAAAFAWLAQACTAEEPANVPAVTGARGQRLLGTLYRGSPDMPIRDLPASEEQLSLLATDVAAPQALFQPEVLKDATGQRLGYNLFVAILPPTEIAQKVGSLADSLRQQHALTGRRLLDQRLHITLHAVAWFDEQIPLQDIQAARAACAGIACPPLPIVFDRVVSFSNRAKPGNNPFVLRCDSPSDAAIARLRQQLAVAFRRSGLRPKPTATPHMTLLYDRNVVTEHAIVPMAWTAMRFALILSHAGHHHHESLGEWVLR